MAYELKLDKYQGPLEKLLELIEERKLAVSEISLAAVTDDFLKYLEKLSEVPPAMLADFIVVASRLVLIKSKSLLPELPLTEEEEEDIKDLEQRLTLYKSLKEAEKHVLALHLARRHAASRPYFLHVANLPPVFYPSANLTVPELLAAIGRVHSNLQKFALATQTIEGTLVSLEEKMREVVERMREIAESSLTTLAPTASRGELVVLFLAILHLAREQLIFLEQKGEFSDIIIRKNDVKDPEA